MARIRGSGNKATELRLMAIFKAHGITGWRRKAAVFGKPDFVFPKQKLAVFVDGCFWHGCPIHATQPKTNAKFWRTKIARNQARDVLVTRTLRRDGWRVLRVWEHELRGWDVARQRVDGRTQCGPEVQRKGERKRVPSGRARSQHELRGIPVVGGRKTVGGKRKITSAVRRNEKRLLARLRRAGLLSADLKLEG